MLDKFHSAILQEMGITHFEEAEAAEKADSDVLPKESSGLEKIQALRASTQNPNSAASKEQSLVDPNPMLLQDVLFATKHLGLALPDTKKWTVSTNEAQLISEQQVILPFQLTSLSSEQKRQLWQLLCGAGSSA